jgi:hypothetical protein
VILGKTEINLSLSIGAVDVTPGTKDPMQAIAVADVALYHAKNLGRNRTVACQKPWLELLQWDSSAHSMCTKCHQNSATQCCVAESQSSQCDSLKRRNVWTMFPVEPGMVPIGGVRI